jgi:hypothetical protein
MTTCGDHSTPLLHPGDTGETPVMTPGNDFNVIAPTRVVRGYRPTPSTISSTSAKRRSAVVTSLNRLG